jgi:hypothetical protein
MERVVIELCGTVTGDTGGVTRESKASKWGRSGFFVWGTPNVTEPQPILEVHSMEQCIGPKHEVGRVGEYRRLRPMTPKAWVSG